MVVVDVVIVSDIGGRRRRYAVAVYVASDGEGGRRRYMVVVVFAVDHHPQHA